MVKFSLYDFLGLLLPGVIFLFFCNTINKLYGLFPLQVQSVDWKINVGISLCFALIIGATLYASNFYLVNKTKWYNRLFGMYKHVADLYTDMNFRHLPMNENLNKKAQDWFAKDVFYSKENLDQLADDERKEIRELQDAYYDRMYYELEYEEKNEQPKTIQSFYYFFRQTALACISLLLLHSVLFALSFIPCSCLNSPDTSSALWLGAILLIILFISVRLARWYRKFMTMKMYWAYFTHIQKN